MKIKFKLYPTIKVIGCVYLSAFDKFKEFRYEDILEYNIDNSWRIKATYNHKKGRENIYWIENIILKGGKLYEYPTTTFFRSSLQRHNLGDTIKYIKIGCTELEYDEIMEAITELKKLIPLRYELFYKFINLFRW